MIWKKLGCVYGAEDTTKYGYAMFPKPMILDENQGKIRIYYTHRKHDNYGFPTYMDAILDGEKLKILYNHNEPIIEHSELGCFDETGVNVTSIIKTDQGKFFYYLGWSTAVLVPFRNAIGLAIESRKSEIPWLNRMFKGPVVDRTKEQPYFCATPCVIFDDNKYKLYYTVAEPWIIKDGKPSVACYISYAESDNGYDWVPKSVVSVQHKSTDHVLTTPFVLKENGIYKMWYSYRGEKYRIGYAESANGIHFDRKDEEVGITVSSSGWDSEMVCYPHVVDLKGKRYMFYCGNDYGKTGFGVAILED